MALLVLALAGSAYTILAGLRIGTFRPKPSAVGGRAPSVSLLRPLHGWEPGLEEALESVLDPAYPGLVEVIFGGDDGLDGAVPVVERLRRAHPDRDIRLVVDARLHGANRKISNVVNMAANARNEVV